jgi:hypothetical protein
MELLGIYYKINMKLLLNNKEIAHFLLSLIDHRTHFKNHSISTGHLVNLQNYVFEEQSKKKFNLDKMREKFKSKIRRAVEADLRELVDRVNAELILRKDRYYSLVHGNLEFFIEKFGEDFLLEQYKKSKKQNFVKGVGYQLDSNSQMIRRSKFNDHKEDCLIRNTVGNESLLVSKIDNKYPFWFIDSGYTNFLEPNKKWHRLVRSHLHYGTMFEAPVDRLGSFKSFPQPWRINGDKILIVEPGAFAASIFHVDLKTWKYKVESELRKYTDKKIVFREKAPKNVRTSLYKELCDDDYYCVININSNAATESIWAGIPAITLDKHITNPVTRNRLEDINDLLRPNLALWLCSLSYSQFTYDELVDGTAARIIKKYHV